MIIFEKRTLNISIDKILVFGNEEHPTVRFTSSSLNLEKLEWDILRLIKTYNRLMKKGFTREGKNFLGILLPVWRSRALAV